MARDGERGRGDWKARLGSRNSGPYAEASGDTDPVDIAAVRRDDALIDAIAGEGQVHTGSAEEYQLATLLADWRAELIAAPLPAEPDLDVIVAAVNQEIGARQVRIGARGGGRLRLLRPIAGTAAALALVIGGMTAFSYNAEPGDPLWRVKEVVFSEQAQTTVVQRAGDDLTEASALVARNPEQAKARLERARDNAGQVSDPDQRAKLMAEWERLRTELAKVSPELAQQLETQAPTSSRPKPTSGDLHATTKPESSVESGGSSSVPQQSVESTRKPSEVTEATPPGNGVPTTAVPTTVVPASPPPVVTTPPVEPSTQEPLPSTAPETGSKPPTLEPTGDGGSGGGTASPPQQPITRVPSQNPQAPVPTMISPPAPGSPVVPGGGPGSFVPAPR